MSLSLSLREKIASWDLFTRCFMISFLLHISALGIYFFNTRVMGQQPVSSQNIKYEEVDVNFNDIPPELIGGDKNPAPVEKQEWIEGTSRTAPDVVEEDINYNAVSGTGTDKDGYLFAFYGDKVPTPIFDFDIDRYFPEAAKKANVTQNIVVVRIQVDEKGILDGVKVISSQARGLGFENAAVLVMKRARYSPGYVKGKPTRMVHEIPLRFILK